MKADRERKRAPAATIRSYRGTRRDRYCGDILIQIGAVESALQSLGYIVLQEHMQTCVVEEVKKGNEAIMEEAIELIKKLK